MDPVCVFWKVLHSVEDWTWHNIVTKDDTKITL